MSKSFSNYFTKTIAAGTTLPFNITGTILKIKNCSVPAPLVTVSFDDGGENPIAAGDTFDLSKRNDDFRKLLFKNSGTVDATVTFFVGDVVISYNPPDNRQASTYLKCCLGLNATGQYNGQNVTIDPNGGFPRISLAVGQTIRISGVDNGHQRQQFIIRLDPASGNLNLQDADGHNGMLLRPSDPPIAYTTDADIIIKASASTALIYITEMFFAAI